MMASENNGTSGAQTSEGQQSSSPRQLRSQQYLKWIGAAMISVGLMSAIISSVLVALNDLIVTDYAGSGIWCGLFFIATGGCAVNAVSNLNNDTIVATLVMAIVNLFLAATMIGIIATSLTIHSGYVFYGGFKAAEGLLISLGLTEMALCGCIITVSVVHLRQCRQQNDLPLPGTGKLEQGCSIDRNDGEDGAGFSSIDVKTPAKPSPDDPSPFSTKQHLNTAKWIGLWQIAVGLASIIISSVIVSRRYGDIGVGIWCGIIFTATGALTFYATSARSKGAVIATVFMSILSSLLLWSMLIGQSILLPNFFWCFRGAYCKMQSEMAIANGLLVVLSVGELIMSLWCTIVCCLAVCRPGFGSCCSCCAPQVVIVGAGAQIVIPTTQGMPHVVAQQHAPATGNVQTRNATTGAANSTS